MVTVAFTQNLQRHISAPTVEVEAGTVGEALEAVFAETPKLRGYVLDDRGEVRKHVAVFLNGDPIRDRQHLTDSVRPDDEVFVMQALSGG